MIDWIEWSATLPNRSRRRNRSRPVRPGETMTRNYSSGTQCSLVCDRRRCTSAVACVAARCLTLSQAPTIRPDDDSVDSVSAAHPSTAPLSAAAAGEVIHCLSRAPLARRATSSRQNSWRTADVDPERALEPGRGPTTMLIQTKASDLDSWVSENQARKRY